MTTSTAPAFRPRFPWLGGDLQTLRNRLAYKPRPLPGTAKAFEATVSDGSGDRLTGTLHLPPEPTDAPLIVLIHGLTGSEDSMYMLESARHHVGNGHAALRLNLRGAGSSAEVSKGYYFGGCWPDILDMLDALDSDLTANGIVLVGYSLGGNVVLNTLPHLPADHLCIGAATVSAPIDSMGAALRLSQRRNRIYQTALLDEMKEVYLALTPEDDEPTRQAIRSAETIIAFDDAITAPMHGFNDAADLYAKTAGGQFIAEATVPLLLIHAMNDPWIPVAPYLTLDPPDNVTVEIAPSGGHVGFHGRGDNQPWHDLRVSAFIDSLAPLDA